MYVEQPPTPSSLSRGYHYDTFLGIIVCQFSPTRRVFSRINTIILEMCKYRLKRNYDEHLVVCWLTWNGWKRKSVEASFGVVSDLLWYNFCIHFFQNQMCSVTAIFWYHRGLGTSEICRARYIASGTINFFGRRSWNYCLLRICSCWTRMKTYFYTDE